MIKISYSIIWVLNLPLCLCIMLPWQDKVYLVVFLVRPQGLGDHTTIVDESLSTVCVMVACVCSSRTVVLSLPML